MRLLLLLAVAVCLLAACQDVGIEGYSGPSAKEQALEEKYLKLSYDFGEKVRVRDWAGAHGMTSSAFQKTFPADKFRAVMEEQLKVYEAEFQTVLVEADINTVDPKEMAEEDYDIPKWVPKGNWRAYSFATMGLEVDADNEIERCYEIGLLWVEEDGQDKVAFLEFMWCD